MQVPQYGAQNQKATGDPLYRDPKSPDGGVTVSGVAAGVVDVADESTLVATTAASLGCVASSAQPAARAHARSVMLMERFMIRDALATTP